MIEKKSWAEFRDAGLLWWINRTLHLFGWAIVVTVGDDGRIGEVYPARTRFRGFDAQCEEAGFIALSEYLKQHAGELANEANE